MKWIEEKRRKFWEKMFGEKDKKSKSNIDNDTENNKIKDDENFEIQKEEDEEEFVNEVKIFNRRYLRTHRTQQLQRIDDRKEWEAQQRSEMREQDHSQERQSC